MKGHLFFTACAVLACAWPGGKVAVRAAEPPATIDFDPAAWLRERKLGRLTVKTPQSDRPLRAIAAATREEWEKERRLYLEALRELIGPWPAVRPALGARVLEEADFPKYVRYKVGFQSLPSSAAYASEIRAWLFVPKTGQKPMPAIVALHQTVPQGKDEPAGVKGPHSWMAFARYYAELGYVTLAPDMIGYGERTAGGYERTGFELADAAPILDKHRETTLLGLMLFDVSRSIDYLETRNEVDRARIGVIGHSQGGFLVNFVLGLEPRFRAGAASCGYGIFRKDKLFPERWAARNSAYLPRLVFYKGDADALPFDFLHIMALAAPTPHLVQTALGDTIWTKPAVEDDPFVMSELMRVHGFYGNTVAESFVSITPGRGATDKDHGWYPEGQKAADELFAKVLRARE